MTYLVTYAIYNEPHTVECTLKQGRFWNNYAVAIDYKIILHVVEKPAVTPTLSYTTIDVKELINLKP